jgi:dihydroorotase
MKAVLPHTAHRFARAIIMPNLRPPVVTTDMAISYRDRILEALPTGVCFQPLMTLYLTDHTTPEEIVAAKASGVVYGVKYYPAGATTHSDLGVTDIARCYATLGEMQRVGMPLLVHGESTDPEVDVFDRERVFIDHPTIPAITGCDGAHHDPRGGGLRSSYGGPYRCDHYSSSPVAES